MDRRQEVDEFTKDKNLRKEEYHPYKYQQHGNGSWAGALPVKQYVHLSLLGRRANP
jgi:hypothetical protein